MTVEEHVAAGGLGQEAARGIAEAGSGNHFRMLAIPMRFPDACYDRDTLLARSGLDADAIATAYRQLWFTRSIADASRNSPYRNGLQNGSRK